MTEPCGSSFSPGPVSQRSMMKGESENDSAPAATGAPQKKPPSKSPANHSAQQFFDIPELFGRTGGHVKLFDCSEKKVHKHKSGAERETCTTIVPAILSCQPCLSGSQPIQKNPRNSATAEN